MWISERFEQAVACHIVSNAFLDRFPKFTRDTPPILGIHGRPGLGKTYQTMAIIRKMGAKASLFRAFEMESPAAGEPARLLVRAMTEAAKHTTSFPDNPAVMVVDDVDAGIGDWGHLVQYTVNRQHVTSALMSYADDPVRFGISVRVPLIVIGNDLKRLYYPLIREGRMRQFHWEPNETEQLEVVKEIFGSIGIEDGHAERIFKRYQGESFAFFSQIRAGLIDKIVLSIIRDLGLGEVIRALNQSQVRNLQFPFDAEAIVERVFERGDDILRHRATSDPLTNKVAAD